MRKIVLTLMALFSVCAVWAQGGPPATPIDGGLSLLIAAGGLYGTKKIFRNQK